MMEYKNLYDYLIHEKNYTESEAYETVVRYKNGMEMPKEIANDIHDYWHYCMKANKTIK